MLDDEAAAKRREAFSPGDMVRAEGFQEGTVDDNKSVPPGTLGRVISVDAIGTVHVAWENGSTLGVLLEDKLSLVAQDS